MVRHKRLIGHIFLDLRHRPPFAWKHLDFCRPKTRQGALDRSNEANWRSNRPKGAHRLASPRRVTQGKDNLLHAGIDPKQGIATIRRNGLVMAAEFEPMLRAEHLDSMERLFADDLGEPLDKPGLASWRQRRRLRLSGEGGATFFIKRFDHPPWSAGKLVRASKTGAQSVAGMEWSWIQNLRSDGIACPRLVALGEERAGGREVRSVLMTEAVPGQSLERWMLRWQELEPAKRDEISQGVARLVAKLHQKGYVHRDLYLSHIFYDHSKHGDESLHLIDLQRVIRPPWRRERWIIKDLASLNYSTPKDCLSRTGRLRWLLVYLGSGKLDAAGRRVVYRVLGKTSRIARREARKFANKRQDEPRRREQIMYSAPAGASPSSPTEFASHS